MKKLDVADFFDFLRSELDSTMVGAPKSVCSRESAEQKNNFDLVITCHVVVIVFGVGGAQSQVWCVVWHGNAHSERSRTETHCTRRQISFFQ